MKILIVEDEAPIAQGLRFNFQQEGYDVIVAGDGPAALTLASSADPPVDLVVLDLMLPGMSGYEICKELREAQHDLPILVLSARPNAEDRAHAFDCGANQYVTKPFDLNEMLSRIRGLLRQFRGPQSRAAKRAVEPPFQFGKVTVDFAKFQVAVGGETHSLTTMEMQLLRYFIEHAGIVLSRNQILRDVWGQAAGITTRSIDNFVLRLRKIVEVDPSSPKHIISVRGTGYRFIPVPENGEA